MLAAVGAHGYQLEPLKAVDAAVSARRGRGAKPGLSAVRTLHPQLCVELAHNHLSLKVRAAQPGDEETVGLVAVRQQLDARLQLESMILVQEPIDQPLALGV